MNDSGVIASVGTTGSFYDNILAQTLNGLYKYEVIKYVKEQLHDVSDIELEILEWVDWFDKSCLYSTIGYLPLFEFEKRYYDNLL